jgi:hypothetical protein
MSLLKGLEAKIIQKAWENEEFKKELLADPRKAIEQLINIKVPEKLQITVVEETVGHHYLVIPVNVDKLEPSDEALETLASGGGYPKYPA